MLEHGGEAGGEKELITNAGISFWTPAHLIFALWNGVTLRNGVKALPGREIIEPEEDDGDDSALEEIESRRVDNVYALWTGREVLESELDRIDWIVFSFDQKLREI